MKARIPAAVASTMLAAVAPAVLLGPSPSAADEPPQLVVYTYNSFVSEWGPGPRIEEAFEAECGCDLRLIGVDDGVAILSRLRLEGSATQADVILGIDLNLIAETRATGLVAPHGLPPIELDLPVDWIDDTFVPYDWGFFAFVYDSEAMAEPPDSLRALVEDSDVEILIQDPRVSTPGLGLLLWMRHVFGDDAAAAWQALRPRIVTVSRGWSEAYGLFLEGEAPMVLSYTTSPAYHEIVEGTDRYRAAMFEEGHYVQVEVAAMVAGTDQPALAQRFLAFVLSPGFQDVIPTTNWMFPVIMPQDGLPEAFGRLGRPDRALIIDSQTIFENRRAWVDEWLDAMSR